MRRRRYTKKHCTVYGLYDLSGNLLYIGQTRLKLKSRKGWFYRGIKQSKRECKRLTPIENWVDDGNEFELRAIDEQATWDVSEIIYIDRARQAGIQLLNVVRGGRDTISDASRQARADEEFERMLAQRVT